MRLHLICVALAATALALGCGGNSTSQNDAGHDHEHLPEQTGPHGGHMVEMNDETYALEWTHDDASNKVTLYVLDGTTNEDAPVELTSIDILSSIEEEEPEKFTLAAVGATDGKANQFELSDAALLTYLKMSEGVANVVSFKIGETDYSGSIEHHDHEDGHEH